MGLMDDLGQRSPVRERRRLGFHLTLVKTIGAGALALLMSRLSASRR